MLISVGCFAAVNLMVKFLPHLPATELVLFRSLITFVISYLLLRGKKVNPWGNNKKWLLIEESQAPPPSRSSFIPFKRCRSVPR